MYTFTRTSRNKKVGPIPVSMTSQDSCPEACQLKNNGCFAENGPVSWNWKKMAGAVELEQFTGFIQSLPRNQLWRHNVAGDLPKSSKNTIDQTALKKIVQANKGKRGFTINVSADNYQQADHYLSLGLPTVTILPSDATAKSYKTESGADIVTCPAVLHDKITCATCELCSKPDRKFIVGFPADGMRKKKANLIATQTI